MNLDGVPFMPHHTHRNSSPSPYRKRAPSVGSAAGDGNGVWGRLVSGAKKITGRGGYDSVKDDDEEERRRSIERRQKETPSAIYAHRSIDVRLFHQPLGLAYDLNLILGHDKGFRYKPHDRLDV